MVVKKMIAVATELELMYIFSFCVLILMFWGVNIYISFAKSKMKNDVMSTRLKTMNYLKQNDYDYQYGHNDETDEYEPELYNDYVTTRERKAKLYKLMYEEFQKRKILNNSIEKDEKNYVEVLDVDTGRVIRYIIDEE